MFDHFSLWFYLIQISLVPALPSLEWLCKMADWQPRSLSILFLFSVGCSKSPWTSSRFCCFASIIGCAGSSCRKLSQANRHSLFHHFVRMVVENAGIGLAHWHFGCCGLTSSCLFAWPVPVLAMNWSFLFTYLPQLSLADLCSSEQSAWTEASSCQSRSNQCCTSAFLKFDLVWRKCRSDMSLSSSTCMSHYNCCSVQSPPFHPCWSYSTLYSDSCLKRSAFARLAFLAYIGSGF